MQEEGSTPTNTKEAKPFEVEVKLRVLAVPEHTKDITQVVWNYLKDFIPDDGPGDAVHIQEFQVVNARPLTDPSVEDASWKAASIKMAMLHGLMIAVRNEILRMRDDRLVDVYKKQGLTKMLQYWDLALEELARNRHMDIQEVCWMMVNAATLIEKAFKIDGLVGPKHLRNMRKAFGLVEPESFG